MSLASETETKKGMSRFNAETTASNYARGAEEAAIRMDDHKLASEIFKHILKGLGEGKPILLSEQDLLILANRPSGGEIFEKLGSIIDRADTEAESAERSIADCKILQNIALEGTE